MKFKPTEKAGGLVVELGPEERQLPSPASEGAAAAQPVFRLKSILVPVDFSQCSREALAYALPFAKQFDAELTLLHVVQPYPPMLEMAPVDMDTLGEAKRELEEWRGMIPEGIRFNTVLRQGAAHIEILRAAKEFNIDLLIISTHGRSGLARVLLGSTAEKVVRHAGCPVLVVREGEHEFVAASMDPEI